MNNWPFFKLLHGRGVTLKALAIELGTKESHLSQVFNGKRGGHTRKHIVKLLTPEERSALGWDEQGKIIKCEVVPCGTKPT